MMRAACLALGWILLAPGLSAVPLPGGAVRQTALEGFSNEVEGVFEVRNLSLAPWLSLERGTMPFLAATSADAATDNELVYYVGAPRGPPPGPNAPFLKVVQRLSGAIGFELVRFSAPEPVARLGFEATLELEFDDGTRGAVRAVVPLNDSTMRRWGASVTLRAGDIVNVDYFLVADLGPSPAEPFHRTMNGTMPDGDPVAAAIGRWRLHQVAFAARAGSLPSWLDDVAVVAQGRNVVRNPGFDAGTACEAVEGPPAEPLVNGGFEAGLPFTLTTDGPARDAIALAGSVAPGVTEERGKTVAPPWMATVRGPRSPASELTWLPPSPTASGRLAIHYDRRDAGPEALQLQQPFGTPAAGLYCGGATVEVGGATDRPMLVQAVLHREEAPEAPFVSDVARWAPGETSLTFILGAEAATIVRFELRLSDAGGSHGALVVLDAVTLRGARLA